MLTAHDSLPRPMGDGASPIPPAGPERLSIDPDRVNADVVESLHRRYGPPDVPALHQLGDKLRTHTVALLPSVEALIDRLWHGSREWQSARSALDRIAERLEEEPAEQPLAAHAQLEVLARDCAWLLDRYTAAAR